MLEVLADLEAGDIRAVHQIVTELSVSVHLLAGKNLKLTAGFEAVTSPALHEKSITLP